VQIESQDLPPDVAERLILLSLFERAGLILLENNFSAADPGEKGKAWVVEDPCAAPLDPN
jgi:hypothetical protein